MKMAELSVVLPVYNERDSLPTVLKEWDKAFKELNVKYVFVVCEDGSNDGTVQIVQRLRKKYPIIMDSKKLRRGYTRAVVDGILTSKTKYILCIDSDGQCDPRDFGNFWKNRQTYDVIKGWRHNRQDPNYRIWLSGVFGLVYRLLFGKTVHDPTAQFVLFNRPKTLEHINLTLLMPQGWGWAFMALSKHLNLKVLEIKINHRHRIGGETRAFTTKKIVSVMANNLVGMFKIRILLNEKKY